jgi:hypothetical protein
MMRGRLIGFAYRNEGTIIILVLLEIYRYKWRKKRWTRRPLLDALARTKKAGIFSAAAANDTSHIPHSTHISKPNTMDDSHRALSKVEPRSSPNEARTKWKNNFSKAFAAFSIRKS